VEQLKAWKNRSKLSDSFDFTFDLNLIDREIWRDLYQTQGLSVAQIAEKFAAAKSTVLKILHHHGLNCTAPQGRSTRPDNYRAPLPPYGYQVRGGKLVPYPKEVEICRRIVRLSHEDGLNWSDIARNLNTEKVPTKKGHGIWHRHTVRRIFERWSKKI
jgi:hypothetical protein